MVRHATLNSQNRSWGGRQEEEDDEGEEGEEEEEGGEETDIKSNNPHLTGGEKNCQPTNQPTNQPKQAQPTNATPVQDVSAVAQAVTEGQGYEKANEAGAIAAVAAKASGSDVHDQAIQAGAIAAEEANNNGLNTVNQVTVPWLSWLVVVGWLVEVGIFSWKWLEDEKQVV